MRRRVFLASGSALLAGCSSVTNGLSQNATVMRILGSAEPLNHLLIGTRGNAQEYSESQIDRDYRVNGLPTPTDSLYQAFLQYKFAQYRLVVLGKVERPQAFTLQELRALKSATQITRHDCVEGWSQIGKWSGVPLATVLALAKPAPDARYVVFHCFDHDDSNNAYYESLNFHQAAHPQTLLALDLNDKPLAPDHGAPVRLRVPTQLGYKSAKWVGGIEVVASFAHIGAGNGGYWEDQGYEWYAGI